MLSRVRYRECRREELKRTAEFDPPVVTWETKVIYVYNYSQILREGKSVGGIHTELHS